MKYVDTMVVFREVPDEISLAINISGCPVRCPGCHSEYLWQDIGTELDEESLSALIEANPGITCVSFMGGDGDPACVARLAAWVHSSRPQIKTCWYSGRGLEHAGDVIPSLDYIKTGPYMDECGPLDRPGTNQRFYRISHNPESLTDMTSAFLNKFI